MHITYYSTLNIVFTWYKDPQLQLNECMTLSKAITSNEGSWTVTVSGRFEIKYGDNGDKTSGTAPSETKISNSYQNLYIFTLHINLPQNMICLICVLYLALFNRFYWNDTFCSGILNVAEVFFVTIPFQISSGFFFVDILATIPGLERWLEWAGRGA